jgi:hypothetical protein
LAQDPTDLGLWQGLLKETEVLEHQAHRRVIGVIQMNLGGWCFSCLGQRLQAQGQCASTQQILDAGKTESGFHGVAPGKAASFLYPEKYFV